MIGGGNFKMIVNYLLRDSLLAVLNDIEQEGAAAFHLTCKVYHEYNPSEHSATIIMVVL
jgi:hypothetical protein